ncbi:MAG: BlaI/MecI/CopY family transcriptional regulator [Ruminococcaceae bacterium]|nr:BlaI/MecI/CopY family transcriptional regulator [Oscillospiraceae bacterium]
MRKPTQGLTPAEWYLMECLWEHSPRTARELIDELKLGQSWSRSTTLTVLRRLVEKEQVRCDENGDVRIYSPILGREEALSAETSSFLNRAYKGSVSLLVSAMTEQQELSREEIDALYEILRRAKGPGEGL